MDADLDLRAAAEELLRQERRATARILHDGPAQSLTAASLRLQAALAFDGLSTETIEIASRELDAASRGLRAALARLAGGIPPETLAATLAALGESAGLAAEAETDGLLAEPVDPADALALAAAAARAAVELAGAGATAVRIVVEADGPVRARLVPDVGETTIVSA